MSVSDSSSINLLQDLLVDFPINDHPRIVREMMTADFLHRDVFCSGPGIFVSPRSMIRLEVECMVFGLGTGRFGVVSRCRVQVEGVASGDKVALGMSANRAKVGAVERPPGEQEFRAL